MRNQFGLPSVLGGVALAISCSVDGGYTGAGTGGAGDDSEGGKSGSGGAATNAGTVGTSAGGSSGAGAASGGAPGAAGEAMGGEPSTSPEAGQGGGAAATGGAPTTAGTGGALGEDGGAPSAGTTSTGGTGGKASGGSTSTGGTGGKASGGSTSTGGTGGKASGGSTSTGGATAAEPLSCSGLAARCQGESCCTSIAVPAGTYKMGRSMVATDPDYTGGAADNETPEHSATVGAFKLDKYEVTVGRFRKFHAIYRTWHVTNANPSTNAGQHRLVGRTGWGQSWIAAAADLPADEVALASSLKCSTTQQTWTDAASSPTAAAESYPINCVSWYTAFAFCVWDGARLPTEAEWEYVASGVQANSIYPWGSAPVDNTRANYGASNASPYVAVGSKPSGAGTLGHLDLSGSLREWVFDWYGRAFYGTASAPESCVNCVNWYQATDVYYRVTRGGSFASGITSALRAQFREDESSPGLRSGSLGFRCARD